jgi:hypothetical protein
VEWHKQKEHLPSNPEALSSIPSDAKKEKTKEIFKKQTRSDSQTKIEFKYNNKKQNKSYFCSPAIT